MYTTFVFIIINANVQPLHVILPDGVVGPGAGDVVKGDQCRWYRRYGSLRQGRMIGGDDGC